MKRRIEIFDATKHAGLAWAFHVSPFSCGNHEHYEQYLRLVAATDKATGMGTTHILIANDGKSEYIAGFVTMKAAAIISECDGVLNGTPAIEISELAVAEECERKGYGRDLLDYAVSVSCVISNSAAAVKHIILCADPASVGFYEKYGFRKLKGGSMIPTEGWNENCIPMYLTIYH